MKKVKKQKDASKLILITIITAIIAATLSLSKYYSEANGTSSATIATPVITLSDDETINLSISPLDGNNKNTYVFEVSNYDENDQISQTSMEYTLKITSLANLPLEFELYTYDSNVQGADNLLSGGRRNN